MNVDSESLHVEERSVSSDSLDSKESVQSKSEDDIESLLHVENLTSFFFLCVILKGNGRTGT